MTPNMLQNTAIAFCGTFLVIGGAGMHFANRGGSQGNAPTNLASENREQQRRDQEEAVVNALRRVKQEEREQLHISAVLHQQKQTEKLQAIYSGILDLLKKALASQPTSTAEILERQMLMESCKKLWEQLDDSISRHNQTVDEQYHIKAPDSPFKRH